MNKQINKFILAFNGNVLFSLFGSSAITYYSFENQTIYETKPSASENVAYIPVKKFSKKAEKLAKQNYIVLFMTHILSPSILLLVTLLK